MTTKTTDAQRAFDNVRTELDTLKKNGADIRLLEVTLEQLSKTIYAEKWAALRAPFPPSMIGKLPRVTCRPCRDTRNGSCPNHQRKWCADCKNTISTAHIHLDYVGHAAVTDRIQAVDPEWQWSIRTCDEQGSPVFDRNGGLWIDITILGVTRPAYGDAEGKSGADAVKAAISDAIKNGAMRFGVGLDLWSKEDLTPAEAAPAEEPKPPRVEQGGGQVIDVDWLKLPATINSLDELTAKARECGEANQFKGAIQKAFLKRKGELEKAAKKDEERALTLVKGELGATEIPA